MLAPEGIVAAPMMFLLVFNNTAAISVSTASFQHCRSNPMLSVYAHEAAPVSVCEGGQQMSALASEVRTGDEQ